MNGSDERCIKNSGRKAQGVRPHGRSGHRWEENKIVLKDIGYKDVALIEMSQDSVQWRISMNA
jgi:hypothetical protein